MVLVWLLIRTGVAPAEWIDQEPPNTEQAA
jgi:hypothetical protein